MTSLIGNYTEQGQDAKENFVSYSYPVKKYTSDDEFKVLTDASVLTNRTSLKMLSMSMDSTVLTADSTLAQNDPEKYKKQIEMIVFQFLQQHKLKKKLVKSSKEFVQLNQVYPVIKYQPSDSLLMFEEKVKHSFLVAEALIAERKSSIRIFKYLSAAISMTLNHTLDAIISAYQSMEPQLSMEFKIKFATCLGMSLRYMDSYGIKHPDWSRSYTEYEINLYQLKVLKHFNFCKNLHTHQLIELCTQQGVDAENCLNYVKLRGGDVKYIKFSLSKETCFSDLYVQISKDGHTLETIFSIEENQMIKKFGQALLPHIKLMCSYYQFEHMFWCR